MKAAHIDRLLLFFFILVHFLFSLHPGVWLGDRLQRLWRDRQRGLAVCSWFSGVGFTSRFSKPPALSPQTVCSFRILKNTNLASNFLCEMFWPPHRQRVTPPTKNAESLTVETVKQNKIERKISAKNTRIYLKPAVSKCASTNVQFVSFNTSSLSQCRSYHGHKTMKDFVRRRRWARYYK